jgi:lysophospholipase L1-like esterase
MKTAILVIALSMAAAAQLQSLPPESPQTVATRAARMEKWLNDWANLARYAQADAQLPAPQTGERRVVFLGDSITDSWNLAEYFPGKPYVNRGISGQTTPQMLIRFRPDVVDLKAAAVVILAGTNDIAGNTGAMTLKMIEDNLASMADIAQGNGMAVVLASVTPVYPAADRRFFDERPPEKIMELNRWLKSYCDAHRLVYLDYFSAMVGSDGLLRRDLSTDGLHPNAAGYKLMAALAQAAIDRALNVKFAHRAR